jgi:hypothetical protein
LFHMHHSCNSQHLHWHTTYRVWIPPFLELICTSTEWPTTAFILINLVSHHSHFKTLGEEPE